MAYATGSYTDPTDLLDKVRAQALTEGWVVNDFSVFETGYRLHLEDATGALFFNFASAVSSTPFTQFSPYPITGIGVNGSTGYSAGSGWDQQPGTGAMSGRGACMGYLKTTGGQYHIFTFPEAIYVFAEGEYQWEQMCAGKTTLDYPLFAASFPYAGIFTTLHTFMLYSFSSDAYRYAISTYINGNWTTSNTEALIPPMSRTSGLTTSTPYLSETLVNASWKQLRGNALQVPTYMSVAEGNQTGNPKEYIGHMDKLIILSGPQYNDGDSVQYGSDEYILSAPALTGNNTDHIRVGCLKQI